MFPTEPDEAATVRLLRPGQKWFGRFTLGRLLGQGGMGVVWLGQDEVLGREVALKFLPDALRTDAAALEELKQEAHKSLDLTHPHIVRVHDLVTDADGAAISMEYVDGPTLNHLRVRQPQGVFGPAVLGPWMEQLCAALDYAHQEVGMVHRDLKPSNLMVNSRSKLKITDFGIARSLSDSLNRITGRRITGTLAYMSPQQLQGEPPAPTDDIYSLGAILFELLTGKPPFHAGDVAGQVLTQVAPRVNQRRAQLGPAGEPVPRHWEETIAACLAKDPAQCPPSARELAGRLGLALPEPVRISAGPAGESKVVLNRRPAARIHRAAAWVSGAAALLLAAGTGWLLLDRRARPTSAAPKPATDSSLVPAPRTTSAQDSAFAAALAALSEAERAEGFRPLFNGVDLTGWQPRYPTRPHGWAAENGTLINHFTNRINPNDLFTTEKFWNFVLRYEYFIPADPPRVFNSGVFLRGRYEIQIGADRSVTNGVPTKNSNAALDNFKPADVFVACAWGAWHEIEATLVGYRLTVRLNGIKVHDNVELTRPTGGQLDDYVDQPGPILLQGLYCAAVFRNLRIKPLP